MNVREAELDLRDLNIGKIIYILIILFRNKKSPLLRSADMD